VELDQKWTWEQLRSMQVGGNASARAFFRAHGCNVTADDLQAKYHSRAAVLYRGRISSLTAETLKKYGTSVRAVCHFSNMYVRRVVNLASGLALCIKNLESRVRCFLLNSSQGNFRRGMV